MKNDLIRMVSEVFLYCGLATGAVAAGSMAYDIHREYPQGKESISRDEKDKFLLDHQWNMSLTLSGLITANIGAAGYLVSSLNRLNFRRKQQA